MNAQHTLSGILLPSQPAAFLSFSPSLPLRATPFSLCREFERAPQPPNVLCFSFLLSLLFLSCSSRPSSCSFSFMLLHLFYLPLKLPPLLSIFRDLPLCKLSLEAEKSQQQPLLFSQFCLFASFLLRSSFPFSCCHSFLNSPALFFLKLPLPRRCLFLPLYPKLSLGSECPPSLLHPSKVSSFSSDSFSAFQRPKQGSFSGVSSLSLLSRYSSFFFLSISVNLSSFRL